jgi:hypothetical protein
VARLQKDVTGQTYIEAIFLAARPQDLLGLSLRRRLDAGPTVDLSFALKPDIDSIEKLERKLSPLFTSPYCYGRSDISRKQVKRVARRSGERKQ